jgi:phage tail-like protein
MSAGKPVEPFQRFRYLVEIEGIQQVAFSECTGLGSQVEVIEYREGGDPTRVRKLPGRVCFPDIVLKWGVTDSRELYDWHLAVIKGNVVRKNGSVVLIDETGREKMRWNFFAAWPSKWEGPSLNAATGGIAIETLTITCECQEQP